TPIAPRGARARYLCRNAFRPGLAARPNLGLAEPVSTHVKAAIYVEHMAGDVTCHRRSEKQCGIDDFAHVAEPTEWNLLLKILGHFVWHTFAHSNVDETGRDRVDGDVLARQLARGNFRQRDDGSFARRIIRLAEETHLAADARKVDDTSAVPQDRHRFLRDVECAGEVHANDAL